jgi:hypothetical protein
MAKEIRTIVWCDGLIHQDEQVEASVSRRFIVDNLKEREIDLCEACDKEYAQPLIDLLKENGQPIKPGQPPTLFEPPTAKARTAIRRPAEIRCPVEDCDWEGTMSAASQHAPRYHDGESINVLEGRFGRRLLDGSRIFLEYPCPDCEAAFENNRSLAGHKVRGH